eukprot:CAMPEP_0184322464 /NCGR_PEP_ID=MMETSP1049-20130417/124608_1 /TAXON_ID=77928 /ORGANISM="Proteomonas sulcata, Strain CCMP704" /LENGTH=95 /DNA_ID=CAMNT_0026643609 /DNA_START=93 /DNA_END=377 /DNA_ORIENTATION=+
MNKTNNMVLGDLSDSAMVGLNQRFTAAKEMNKHARPTGPKQEDSQKLSDKDLEKYLSALFEMLDRKGEGQISEAQLAYALDMQGLEVTPNYMNTL